MLPISPAAKDDLPTRSHALLLLPPRWPSPRAGTVAVIGKLDPRRLLPCRRSSTLPPPRPLLPRSPPPLFPRRVPVPAQDHHLVHPPAQRVERAPPPVSTTTTATRLTSSVLPPPLTPPPLRRPVQKHVQDVPGVEPGAAVPLAVPSPLHEPHHHRLAPVARVGVGHLPLGVAPPLPINESQNTVTIMVIIPAPPPAVAVAAVAVTVPVPIPPPPAAIVVQVVVRVRLLQVIRIGGGGHGQHSRRGGQGLGCLDRGRAALLDLLDGPARVEGVRAVGGITVGPAVAPGGVAGAVWAVGPVRDGAGALWRVCSSVSNGLDMQLKEKGTEGEGAVGKKKWKQQGGWNRNGQL